MSMSKHRAGRSVEDTICTALMRDPDVASVVEQAVQAACAYLGSVIGSEPAEMAEFITAALHGDCS